MSRYYNHLIHALLLCTTPTLSLHPHSPRPHTTHIVKEGYSQQELSSLSYKEIIQLLEDIENGNLEEPFSQTELSAINHFLANLARQGMTDENSETFTELNEDIQELLGIDINNSDNQTIFTQAALWSGWFQPQLEKTTAFIKKYKKELIIAAIAVTTIAIIVTVSIVAAAPSIGALVAVAGEALAHEDGFASSPIPIKEESRIVSSLVAHDYVEKNSPSPEVAYNNHKLIDHSFNTNYTPHYNCPTTNSPSLPTLYYQSRGEKAFEYGYYSQTIQDCSKAIELTPSHLPSYLDRSMANFELGKYDASLSDFQTYTTQSKIPESFSASDFSIGFAKGLPKGVYDSGESLLMFLSDAMTHPIHTGKQMWEAMTLLKDLAHSQKWEAFGEVLAPEVHQLITEWDHLSSEERGQLAGYALGKHGSDIIVPGVLAKGLSRGIKGSQELNTIYRSLQTAEKTLLIESASQLESGASISKIVQLEKQISEWLGEGTKFIKNEAGDSIFLSQDGLKCVRFDFNRTKPHNNPHAHVEVKINGEWVKSGQIYPVDVPHN